MEPLAPDPEVRHGGRDASAASFRTNDAFRLFVSAVTDYAIFMLDPEGNLVSWNEGAQRIKGYREEEILGKHFSVFYEQSDIDAGKPDWELVAAERHGRILDEGWRVRKDGTRFWASVAITALRDGSGRLRGFGKVTRDITEQKAAAERRAEQQRREAATLREHAYQLAQLERAKSEFLKVASHELRGPLAVLRGYLSMFEDGTFPPQQLPSVLPVISGKLHHIEFLVQRMLETARMEADRIELHLEPLDLCRLAERVVASYRSMVQDGHEVSFAGAGVPVLVHGDRSRLETVVSNLVDNAIKYSPGGGPVECLVAQRRGRAFFSVADRGLGIAEDAVRDTLFTRFGRIVTPDNAHIDGTGLGLYVARQITRQHGGEILVESQPGSGSRFTVVLPLRADQPLPPAVRVRRPTGA